MTTADPPGLAQRLMAGEPAALARAITRVETGSAQGLAILRAIHPAIGRGASLGVTGAPARASPPWSTR